MHARIHACMHAGRYVRLCRGLLQRWSPARMPCKRRPGAVNKVKITRSLTWHKCGNGNLSRLSRGFAAATGPGAHDEIKLACMRQGAAAGALNVETRCTMLTHASADMH